MRKIVQLALMGVLFTLISATSILAQKIAYVDSDAILREYPAKKQMDLDLEQFRANLQNELQAAEDTLKAYAASVYAKIQQGEMSPVQQKKEEEAIQQKRSALQLQVLQADQKFADKEKELSQPIIDKFNAALDKVATEKGYAYILDIKLFLYLKGGIDATADVKAAM